MRCETNELVAGEGAMPSSARYRDSFSDRVWTYESDPENRLLAAAVPGGSLRVDYRYDAFGRQIERRTSGTSVTTNRMYYAGWQLIAEYNGTGTLQRKYVYGPGIDEPVRMTASSTKYFYHSDGLGSVTEITTNGGFKVESYTYDVYGTPTIYNSSLIIQPSSLISNRLLFTGRDRDPDTTLYNYRYRYYSPSLGRFVQVDPVGLLGGDINLCRYARNSPVVLVDPSGLRHGNPVPGSASMRVWTCRTFLNPVFNPNDSNENCYLYARCRRNAPLEPGQFGPVPGFEGGRPYSGGGCAALRAAAVADGLVESNSEGCCPIGYHRVHAFLPFDGPDFHFFREDRDGTWSHQPGDELPCMNVDGSGRLITDPSLSNRDFSGMGSGNYPVDCGVLCAPN